jgi:hypothetical protein
MLDSLKDLGEVMYSTGGIYAPRLPRTTALKEQINRDESRRTMAFHEGRGADG